MRRLLDSVKTDIDELQHIEYQKGHLKVNQEPLHVGYNTVQNHLMYMRVLIVFCFWVKFQFMSLEWWCSTIETK